MAKTITHFLRYAWQSVLELLFPPACASCHCKLLNEEAVVCAYCMDRIARTEHANHSDNGVDMLIRELLQHDTHHIKYISSAAWAYYNRDRGHILRKLIERGKFGYRANPMVFYQLGRAAATEYVGSEVMEDVDLLVPIPLSRQRMRERGFNQSEYICRGISSVLGIEVDTTHLLRVRDNAHQSRLSISERKHNVDNIFTLQYPEEWKNKHILLVDDVITSGNTIYAAMQCTSSVRGCHVGVFTLGWAHQ